MHERWFKCCTALKFECENKIQQFAWEPKLKQLAHIPIKKYSETSIGFSPVFGWLAPDMQSHELQNFLFISMTLEEKKIDKKLLKNRERKAIDAKAKSGNVKINELGKDVIDGIKASVKKELIGETLASEEYLNAIIDIENNVLFVNSTSSKNIEKLCDFLSRIDDSLVFKNYFDASLELHLTSWLYSPDRIPEDIALGEEASLQSSDKAKATLKNQDLESEEIKVLLNHEKKVTEIAVTYKARMALKMNSDGIIKNMKPTDLLKNSVERNDDNEDACADLEADWIVCANEVYDIFKWFEDNADVKSSGGSKSTKSNVVSMSSANLEEEASDSLSGMTG